MKIKSLITPWTSAVGYLVLALGLAVSPPVLAQDDSEDPADLGKVTVTGSRIKRVDMEGPSPVVIITAQEMEQRGFSQVSELLDSLVQNTGGTADQSFTFGFIPATSAPDLRGFGQNATLVLIDGRRLPVYPVPQSGVENIVDFASIPTVQIERIEILTDGASAIYGSDAIAGVINIITRKDFDGVSLDLRVGDTADGGYKSERVQLFMGTGPGDTRISASFEYWHNDPIWARDREYAGSDIANPRGSYSVGGATFVDVITASDDFIFQSSNCGEPDGPLGGLGIPDQGVNVFGTGAANEIWCGFNRTAFRQLFAEQKRTAGSIYFEHDLSETVTTFGKVGFTDQRTNWQLEPNFYGAFVFGSTPNTADVITPLTQPAWGWVPGGQANNYAPEGNPGIFVRRLIEFGARTTDLQNNGIQALAGLRGTFGSRNVYDWDVAIAYNETDLVVIRPNIISSTFNEAVSGGLDLFQPIPQSVVDATSFLATRNAESTNVTIDATISGDTGWEIQGRPVAFAAHTDFTSEDFTNTPDPISANGDAFDGGSAGNGERDHYGLGVELAIPLLDSVYLSAALRYDDYQDDSTTGDATSPKIGIEWRPTRDLLIRGGWGQSFRAPDMQRLFGATTNAFTTVNDPVFDDLEVQSVAIRSGSNPDLVPEEGTNYNVGVVWEAFDGFTMSVDWISIELEDIVTTLSIQSILDICGPLQDGPTCDAVTRDAQGTLQGGFVSSQAQNLALQSYEGIDFDFRYVWDTDRYGTITPQLSGAWVSALETQTTSASPPVKNIGFATLPEWRINFNLMYDNNDFHTTLFVIWVDEMCGINGGDLATQTCEPDEFIDPYTLVNLNASYDFGDYGRFTLGVNNLFNEDPSDDPTSNNWPWFFNNGGYSNPIGREVTLAYNKQF